MHPIFALFMAAVAFTQASHAVMYALGTIHWRALGLGEGEIGALWAAAVAAEIVFLVTVGTGRRAAARPGPRAGAARALAGILRWGAMMADPTGFWLWPIQGLHALTFAMAHLGAIAFIARAVPDRDAAAAQGATGSMAVGGVMALGMALAAVGLPGARRPHLRHRRRAVGARPRLRLGPRPQLAGEGWRCDLRAPRGRTLHAQRGIRTYATTYARIVDGSVNARARKIPWPTEKRP